MWSCVSERLPRNYLAVVFVQLSVAWIFKVDTAEAKKVVQVFSSGFLFCFIGRGGGVFVCLLGCLFVCSLYFICLEWLEGNLVDRVQQCTKCSAKQCKLLSTLIGIFSQWRLGFVFTISACVWLTYFFPASLCRIRLATHPVKASSVFCPKYVINPALHGLEIHRMSLDLRST